MMKRISGLSSLLLLGGSLAAPLSAQTRPFPNFVSLPTNFTGEGVTLGIGSTFYVGSTGAKDSSTAGEIVVGDLRTGAYQVLAPANGTPAGDMHFDPRSGLLWVATLSAGGERVYNAANGALVASFQLSPPKGVANDEVITSNAVYVTDSVMPSLYRIPVAPDGAPGTNFDTIPLPSALFSGFVSANGIVASPDEKYLIVGVTKSGQLYRISASDFTDVELIQVDAPHNDGLLLQGNTLYVAENKLNQVAVIRLAPDLLSGVVLGYLTDPNLQLPTSVARFGDSTYAVNGLQGAVPSAGPMALIQLPSNAPKFLNIQTLGGQESFASFVGAAGQNYDLQASSDLVNWNGVATLTGAQSDPSSVFIDPTNALFLRTDSAPPLAPRRFYRVVQADTNAIAGDHLQTGIGEEPESITADAQRNIYMSILPLSKIKKITPDGVATDIAQIPGPGVTVGIKVDSSGNIYIIKRGAPNVTGVWKVTPDGAAALFAPMPNSKGLNDMALDGQGNIYVTDSLLGSIYKVDANGNASVWKADPSLLPQTFPPVPFPLHPGPGANGIVFSLAKTTLYVVNTTAGSIVQIPLNADGAAGAASVLVQDNSLVGGDGIALDANGNIIVGNNAYSRVLSVSPQGVVATLSEGGLFDITSSVTFVPGGDPNALYVCNFGFPALGGNPAFAGVVKLDLASKVVTPVAYFNQDIVFSPIHHATFVVKWGSTTIYSDPVGGAALFQQFPPPDLILITHIHPDHFDTNTLSAVATPATRIVAPANVYAAMPAALQNLTTILSVLPGGVTDTNLLGISIHALPAYNTTAQRLNSHPKSRGDNGYVLTISGKRIYISGDTEDTPEMRALTNIDVVFVCMNLPFTMDINQAASAVRQFKPRVVYPFHFNGFEFDAAGKPDFTQRQTQDIEQFKSLVGDDLGIEVRLAPWYSRMEVGDRLETSDGPVIIHPIHHAGVALSWNGKTIYNDPALKGAAPWQGYPPADLILVSHVHGDHFDVPSLEALKGTNTVIIAPESVFTNMPPDLQTITTVLSVLPGGVAATNLMGIDLQAIPAYNYSTNRLIFHPKARGDNGYVLTIGGKRIYFSGDTEDTPEMRALQNIDVAFICMAMPPTMDVKQAASAVRAFKPRIVYPYHFMLGMYPPAPPGQGAFQDIYKFKSLVGTDLSIEVRIWPWWYPGME